MARLSVIGFTLILFGRLGLAAQQDGPAGASTVGAVSFPISCPAAVAPAFERGVALLHSFEYPPAREQFQQVEQRSPDCAIAYWGDALTYYHQLWERPSAEEIASALKAVNKAVSAGTKNAREQAYIKATAAFYGGGSTRTYEDRWTAYSRAMQDVTQSFPADHEAAAFYALSLIASPHAADNDQAQRKQAVAILQPLFAADPHHPGLAHYLIHACDNPEMAQQGLAAARAYASIAPASPHALHMPSHIFARLGLWQDDIQSNLASKAAAERLGERAHELHAMDFLEYAYLQSGQDAKAQAIVTEALNLKSSPAEHPHSGGRSPGWVSVHFQGAYALETGNWKQAQAITAARDPSPEWRVLAAWTQAVASGHLRDLAHVRSAVDDLNRALEEVHHTSYAYIADDLTPLRDEAQAWLDFTSSRLDEATDLLNRVAAMQDAKGKGETDIPAREMLADMLLLSNKPEDAAKEYTLSLKTDPNRRHSLQGAAKAAAAP